MKGYFSICNRLKDLGGDPRGYKDFLSDLIRLFEMNGFEFSINDKMPGCISQELMWVEFFANIIIDQYKTPMPKFAGSLKEIIDKLYIYGDTYHIQLSLETPEGDLVPYTKELYDTLSGV